MLIENIHGPGIGIEDIIVDGEIRDHSTVIYFAVSPFRFF